MSRKVRTLLCIDDDTQGLTVRKLLLEAFGFQVKIASSGREGLKLFRSSEVDAVLIDYEMPQMNGVQLADELKRRRRQIPVVMLSAYPSIPDDARGHVDAFVTKGGPTVELIDIVQQKIEDRLSATPLDADTRAARVAVSVGGAIGAVVKRVSSTLKPERPRRLVGHFPVHKPSV